MMNVFSTIKIFSKLSLCSIVKPRNIFNCSYPLQFQATGMLLGEPLKKKKKLDISIIRGRIERKKKKLEKQIRQLEKHSKQLKPISELEIPTELIKGKEERIRHLDPLTPEISERRALLKKEWSKYKHNQWYEDQQQMESLMWSQENALKELKAASEQLYKKAIEFDEPFIPYTVSGPVNTPPIPNYDSPDGVYTNVTIVYKGET